MIILKILDSNFLQTLAIVAIGIYAYRISKLQQEAIDTVELHGYCALEGSDTDHLKPYIRIQNIGTRIIYLDEYVFNGKVYKTNKHVLPSVYSGASANFYWIELPTNAEKHVSVTIFFYDIKMKRYKSEIIAELLENSAWAISTYPKVRI